MTTETPFDLVISKLRDGDADAASEIFRRFVPRLIALANSKLDGRFRSKEDPEDVVLSVYKSFFRRDGRLPYELADWEGLWGLLAKITVRKCIRKRQFWRAECRDVGREAASLAEPSDDEWREALDRGPTADQVLVLAETLDRAVGHLMPQHREIAELSFQDYSGVEIAERCGCSERTVSRVLFLVRHRLRAIEAEGLDG